MAKKLREAGMAKDFIKIDRTIAAATQSGALADYVRAFRNTLEAGARIKAVMEHNSSGSDFADVEALYGLAAGKGEAVYNLVAGSVGALNGTAQSADGKTMTEQVG